MIIPNIWKNKSHVPNHQPAGIKGYRTHLISGVLSLSLQFFLLGVSIQVGVSIAARMETPFHGKPFCNQPKGIRDIYCVFFLPKYPTNFPMINKFGINQTKPTHIFSATCLTCSLHIFVKILILPSLPSPGQPTLMACVSSAFSAAAASSAATACTTLGRSGGRSMATWHFQAYPLVI